MDVDLDGVIAELAPRVLRYVTARVGDSSLAEEIAQESLASLVRCCRNGSAPNLATACVSRGNASRRRRSRSGGLSRE